MKSSVFFAMLIAFFTSSLSAQWINYNMSNTQGVQANLVTDICQYQNNPVWFATNNGLFEFDQNQGLWKSYGTSVTGDPFIYDVFIDHLHRIWAASIGGVMLQR